MEPLEERQLLTVVSVALGQNAQEGLQSGSFLITRDTTDGSLTVPFTIDQSASTANYWYDYSSPSPMGSVMFAPGQATVVLTVTPVDDSTAESDESVVIVLGSGSGYSLATGTASLLILDNDTSAPATVNVAVGQDASEPSQGGYFTITRDNTAGNLTVPYSIDTSASSAVYGSDYSYPSPSGSVTFYPGQSSAMLSVIPIDDTAAEGDESVVLHLQSGTGFVLGQNATASLLIHDNDTSAPTTVNVTVGQDAAEPSQSGYFTIARDNAAGSLTVPYWIDSTASSAVYGSDFSSPAPNGSVTFYPGQSSVMLSVTPIDDMAVEGDESVVLHLHTGTGFVLGQNATASLLIHDDDSAPSATVSVAVTQDAAEPSQNGLFTVTRDNTAGSLSVGYWIDQSASTASYGSDYSAPATSGAVTFAAGESTVTLALTPVDDNVAEPAKSIVLRLQGGAGYAVGAGTATMLLADDDVHLPPAIASLSLLNDTGTSPTDLITTDPTVTGVVTDDGGAAGIYVEFDLNGDGAVESARMVDGSGHFTYAPADLALGPVTVRVRAKEWDTVTSGYLYSDWASLSFTLASAVNAPPVVSSLALVHGDSSSGTLVTSDPALTGQVTNDNGLAYLRVEFDLDQNGTVDGMTRTAEDGTFNFTPQGLQPGEITVRARAVEWDSQTSSELFGDWASLTFTFQQSGGPVVNNLRLVADTGDSGTDLVTSDPRITGEVTTADGNAFGLTVEVDTNGDGTAEGTVLTDNQGRFVYSPQNLSAGEVTVKARALGHDTGSGAAAGAWASLGFTLVQSTAAAVADLHLVNDDGASSTDKVTTDPELAGQVTPADGQSRTTVQFDHDGDDVVDGTATTDADGNFRYQPVGLPNGPVTVRARPAQWDVGSSAYFYGDWTSFSFTLEAAVTPGNTSRSDTTAATAQDRSISAGINFLNQAIAGSGGTAGALTAIQIGAFTPLASQAAGFVPHLNSTAVPQSDSYSSTDTFSQTVPTEHGHYATSNTVTTTYTMTVTGDASSGSFVLDVSIDQTTLYEETWDAPIGMETTHWTIHDPGTYVLTFHASGSYSVSGGMVLYVGTYTASETASSDPVEDESGSSAYGLWVEDWTWHDAGHHGTTRDESGSFDAAGVTGTFTFSESGSGSNAWDDTGDYSDGYQTGYTTTSSAWSYDDSETGGYAWTYGESGTITAGATTGTYNYVENGDDSYNYAWDGNDSYHYVDAVTDQLSGYTFTSTTAGESGHTYAENGTFDGSGDTGTYTYEELGDYTESYAASGSDSADYHYAYGLLGGSGHTWQSYAYTEADRWLGDSHYTESGSFTAAETSGQWTYVSHDSDDAYHYAGSGQYGWSYTTGDVDESYSSAYNDLEDYTFQSTYNAQGTFVGLVETGSYTLTETSTDHSEYHESDGSNYAIHDGTWSGSATTAYQYDEHDNFSDNYSDAGSFDAAGSTGDYLYTSNETGGYTESGSGSWGYQYLVAGWTGGYSGSYSESGSGDWTNGYYEITHYTPSDTSGLYNRTDTTTSSYNYSGSGSDDYAHSAASTAETWHDAWSESFGQTYGDNYQESGLMSTFGPVGSYEDTETYGETYAYAASGNYTYSYETTGAANHRSSSYNESGSDGWGSTYHESGVFGPGGEQGVYSYAESGSSQSVYSGSGDADSSSQAANGNSSSNDHWHYAGQDQYGWGASDAGSFTDEGDTGFYQLTETWGGSFTYDANGAWHYTSSFDGTTAAGNGTYTDHNTAGYAGISWRDESYTPTVTLAAWQSDESYDTSATHDSHGLTSFASPMESTSSDSTSHSVNTTHQEWHTSGASGPDGWTSTSSTIVGGSTTNTYTSVFTDSQGHTTTASGNWSSNWSTPSSFQYTVGTPPSTPLAPPTAAALDFDDYEALLTALATDAVAANAQPATAATQRAAGVEAFRSLDADENGQNGGGVYEECAAPAEGQQGSGTYGPPLPPWQERERHGAELSGPDGTGRNVGFGDGSARFMSKNTDPTVWNAERQRAVGISGPHLAAQLPNQHEPQPPSPSPSPAPTGGAVSLNPNARKLLDSYNVSKSLGLSDSQIIAGIIQDALILAGGSAEKAFGLVYEIRNASNGALDNDHWASVDHFFNVWTFQNVYHLEAVGGFGSGLLGCVEGLLANIGYAIAKAIDFPLKRDNPLVPPSPLTWQQYSWGGRGALASLNFPTNFIVGSEEWRDFLKWLDQF